MSFGIPDVRPRTGSRVERVRLDGSKIPALFARLVAAELTASVERSGAATLCVSFAEELREPLRALARTNGIPWCLVSLYIGDNCGSQNGAPEGAARGVIETLVEPAGIPRPNVHVPRSVGGDIGRAAEEYEASLPSTFDVLVLCAGADGRVAGLLPHSPALREGERRVTLLPGEVPERYTLTGRALAASRCTIVLATGLEKARAVADALEGAIDPARCPARLVRDAVWLMDHEAASLLTGSWPNDVGAEAPAERPNTHEPR
ncbi:MAG: 6-phosphogluconolactonase [Pseudomonadota bacterium]